MGCFGAKSKTSKGLPIKPNNLIPPFSEFFFLRRTPITKSPGYLRNYVPDLGVPLDTFSELSVSAFIPLYCAIVRSHQKYSMEANSLNPGAYIYHLEWVERHATRHVPYVEWLHQLNHASELTSSWPSRCSRV